MNTYHYRTNIECEGCLERILPHLNDYKQIREWHVDLSHADRILVVETELTSETVISIVKSAGFEADSIPA